MVKAIDAELDRMIAFDIIEPVNEPVERLSQLVVVPKKKQGEVRLKTDMGEANKAIIRVNGHGAGWRGQQTHARHSQVDAGLGSRPYEDQYDTEPVAEALSDNLVESGQPAQARRRGRPIGSTNEARRTTREAEPTATTGPNERRYPQRDKQEPERFQAGQRRWDPPLSF